MTHSVAQETLTCGACRSPFTRDRKRGVKPKNCPDCTQILVDQAQAAATAEERTQTLHCESCGQDWERTAQRGKPPKRCDSCKGSTPQRQFVQVNRQEIIDAADSVNNMLQATSGTGMDQYTIARLLKDHPDVSVEEQYKFAYIQSQLKQGKRPVKAQAALKRVWTSLEGNL